MNLEMKSYANSMQILSSTEGELMKSDIGLAIISKNFLSI